LRRIGRVIHVTPGEKAVVKAERTPKVGEAVIDEDEKRVGVVFDVFGPTVSPYVEIDIKTKDPQDIVGRVLYLPSSSKQKNRSRRRK